MHLLVGIMVWYLCSLSPFDFTAHSSVPSECIAAELPFGLSCKICNSQEIYGYFMAFLPKLYNFNMFKTKWKSTDVQMQSPQIDRCNNSNNNKNEKWRMKSCSIIFVHSCCKWWWWCTWNLELHSWQCWRFFRSPVLNIVSCFSVEFVCQRNFHYDFYHEIK